MKSKSMATLWTVLRKELLDISRDHRTLLLGLMMGPLLMPVLILGMGAISENRSKTQLEEVLELLEDLDKHATYIRRRGGDFADYVEKRSPEGAFPAYLVKVREGNHESVH